MGQFDCGSLMGWKRPDSRRILRGYDTGAIHGFYQRRSGGSPSWDHVWRLSGQMVVSRSCCCALCRSRVCPSFRSALADAPQTPWLPCLVRTDEPTDFCPETILKKPEGAGYISLMASREMGARPSERSLTGGPSAGYERGLSLACPFFSRCRPGPAFLLTRPVRAGLRRMPVRVVSIWRSLFLRLSQSQHEELDTSSRPWCRTGL